jgi:hypothetical protein
MQVLITDLSAEWSDENGNYGQPKAWPPLQLPLVELAVSSIPHVALADGISDTRGETCARAMQPGETPPILIAHGHFLDGRHRVWAHRHHQVQTIAAIDLSEYVDVRTATGESMGIVGTSAAG